MLEPNEAKWPSEIESGLVIDLVNAGPTSWFQMAGRGETEISELKESTFPFDTIIA